MNTITKIAIAAVLCALSFWLGRFSLSHQVVIYHSVQGITEVFPRNDPNCGLDMALYAAVLSELRSTNSQKGLSDLEVMLDDSVERAEHRRPLLSGWALEQLDKGLGWAARYREKYPRPLSKGTGFYWTADQQKKIDTFLSGFTNAIGKRPTTALEYGGGDLTPYLQWTQGTSVIVYLVVTETNGSALIGVDAEGKLVSITPNTILIRDAQGKTNTFDKDAVLSVQKYIQR